MYIITFDQIMLTWIEVAGFGRSWDPEVMRGTLTFVRLIDCQDHVVMWSWQFILPGSSYVFVVAPL